MPGTEAHSSSGQPLTLEVTILHTHASCERALRVTRRDLSEHQPQDVRACKHLQLASCVCWQPVQHTLTLLHLKAQPQVASEDGHILLQLRETCLSRGFPLLQLCIHSEARLVLLEH